MSDAIKGNNVGRKGKVVYVAEYAPERFDFDKQLRLLLDAWADTDWEEQELIGL